MKGYDYAKVTEGTIVKFKEDKPWYNSGKRGVVIHKHDNWVVLEAINKDDPNSRFVKRGSQSGTPYIVTTYHELELDDF